MLACIQCNQNTTSVECHVCRTNLQTQRFQRWMRRRQQYVQPPHMPPAAATQGSCGSCWGVHNPASHVALVLDAAADDVQQVAALICACFALSCSHLVVQVSLHLPNDRLSHLHTTHPRSDRSVSTFAPTLGCMLCSCWQDAVQR
jgi:hypothetical protein